VGCLIEGQGGKSESFAGRGGVQYDYNCDCKKGRKARRQSSKFIRWGQAGAKAEEKAREGPRASRIAAGTFPKKEEENGRGRKTNIVPSRAAGTAVIVEEGLTNEGRQ